MSDYKERRNYPRVEVKGASVVYKKRNGFDLLSSYSLHMPMKDLAKGGVCFETESYLDKGITINMKLDIPGEKKIQMKGTIVWTANITNNGRTFAGVQFLPFGKGKRYNSFESWEKLDQITNRYQTELN